MPKTIRWTAIAAAAAIAITVTALFLTNSSASSSLSPANQRVCAHLIAQKRWFENLPRPGIADMLRLEEYIVVDAAEADGQLRKDLAAGVAAIKSRQANTSPIGTRISQDCHFR